MTMGRPVVMGRRTFQSLTKPLDGRDNIVVTRDTGFHPAGAETAASLAAALDLARGHACRRGVDEICVIGGGEIYAAALPLADRICLTRVHAQPAGDTVLALPDGRDWRLVSSEAMPRGLADDHDTTLMILERVAGGAQRPAAAHDA